MESSPYLKYLMTQCVAALRVPSKLAPELACKIPTLGQAQARLSRKRCEKWGTRSLAESKITLRRRSQRPTRRFPETGDAMADSQPTPDPRPDPNEKLVKVFDSEDESEALVVKGLLDSAEIDSDLQSASLLQDAFPGLGGMIIVVREEDAEAALRLIAEQRRSPAEDDVTAEIAIIEEPPPKG